MPTAISVTKRHFPNMAHVGDITKLHGGELPPVDIITFGSPCQDLSTANGNRQGLEGARSGLFMEAIRIIKEMRGATNGKYPRYAVFENVTGAFSSAKGRDFQQILQAFCRVKDSDSAVPEPPKGKWTKAGLIVGDGYSVAYRTFSADLWGVPQRRRRIFAVADFGGGSAGKILFEREGLLRHFESGGPAWQSLTAYAQRGAGGEGAGVRDCPIAILNDQGGSSLNVAKDDLAPTLRSETHGNLPVVATPNCLNPWDTQQSRVFTGDGNAPTLAGADGGGGRNPAGLVCATSDAASQPPRRAWGAHGGNWFPPVRCAGAERPATSAEVARTLEVYALCGKNSNAMLSSNPNSGIYKADTSRTLDQNGGNPACNQGGMLVVAHPEVTGTLCASGAGLSRPAGLASETDLCVAYCLQGNMIGRDDKNGPRGSGVREDKSFCLNTVDWHSVAAMQSAPNVFGQSQFGNYAEGGSTLRAKGGDHGGGSENLVTAGSKVTGYIVRRLTPTECERLQGYPDGWTAFGVDEAPISDTRRYQMLGNSVAIPCVAYVLEGIALALNREEVI